MTRRGRSTKNTKKMAHAIDHNDEEIWASNIENDYDDTVNIVESPSKTFLGYLNELEQKKEPVRENALCSIIEILNNGKEHESLQKNIATCLYRILDLIKKHSSSKVKQLASHALGLLAMTLCHTNNAQEIYTESLPALIVALSKTSKMVDSWTFIALLNSLAMVTFFCSSNIEETEAAMQVIWEFFLPTSKFNASANNKKVPASIISTAVTAWSFLLSSVDAWELNHKNWQGAISHFLHMLEADDELVYLVGGEALAVIFNHDSVNKFFKEGDQDLTNISSSESTEIPLKYSERKSLIKDNILKQLEKLSIKAMNETSLKQSFSNNAARPDWDVLKYFRDDNFPPSSQRIYGHELTVSSPSQMIQLKFLKNFIGEEEFGKHMLKNELFHYLFELTPIHTEDSSPELYESTMVKIVSPVILREEQYPELLTRKEKKKERNLRNSAIYKAKTKVLNKRRMFAEERKGKMHLTESEL